MMRYIIKAVLWALLFSTQCVGVQAQSAVWKFPVQGANLQPNTIDTVLLDWTSTLPSTILRMWCQNGTVQSLVSSFFVDSTGPFKYLLTTYDPNETKFPLSCHAELAQDPLGTGLDSPAGIIWSSNPAQAAKTISQTQATSSVTVTVVSTPLPITAPTSVTVTVVPKTSQITTPFSISHSGVNTSLSLLTTSAPAMTPTQPTQPTQFTSISSTISGIPTAAPQQSIPTRPNDTSAIIGGAIGGVALISFTLLALLFLRRYKQKQGSSYTEPLKKSFYIFDIYKKRGEKANTAGVFEKEGDTGAHEKEAHTGQVYGDGRDAHELQESPPRRKSTPRETNQCSEMDNNIVSHNLVELPDGSNYYP